MRSTLGLVALALTSIALAGVSPALAEAKELTGTGTFPTQPAWCAPELESLPAGGSEACYLDGRSHGVRRTLVIFLHGAVAKNTIWSWNHERQVLKLAKASGIEVLFPRGPKNEHGFVWPGGTANDASTEQALTDGWMAAKRALEQRDGKPFDEVFVMGFSSGAYFASSLAMRGRLPVDGYAAFAGGQPGAPPQTPVSRFAPVFVGVCSEDESTASHSRALAASLSAAGIPRAVVEQPVGHGLSHVHFNSALSYLRHMKKTSHA